MTALSEAQLLELEADDEGITDLEAVARYVEMRKNGQSINMASVLALRKPPLIGQKWIQA